MLHTSFLMIDQITERFERNSTLDASEDIFERIFHICEDRIQLIYHTGEDQIAPCTREFIKPVQSDDRRTTFQLHADTHTSFQVNPYAFSLNICRDL
ncbi:unnamed protein product [Protopolystoma xenopodis]|uniref:Dynein regulatory complex subunit 7 MORN domain-containing protein n=1 Tax=Protopolystoma xenopodis TaxID=117903 RepID=A0A448X8D0_9PLAT|nr:unnamed protein product [Protopolystoma xenopodis]